MAKYFGAPIVSRYSNVENGILAQQDVAGSADFFINHASYKIEVLNMDDDDPSPCGTPGRIVVTDLFNYGMPMIRYDTGDVGILEEGKDLKSGIPFLSKVEGRRMDQIFNTSGDLVSSFTVTNNMWKYGEIKQYQLIQDGRTNYTFKLNTDGLFEREDQLVTEFNSYLGGDAIINIEYVAEIPLLASGKRRMVINNYRK